MLYLKELIYSFPGRDHIMGTNAYHRLSQYILFNLGIRLYMDDMAPDERQAKALMYNHHYIDIYSNSWGPGDMGFEVRGPGNSESA